MSDRPKAVAVQVRGSCHIEVNGVPIARVYGWPAWDDPMPLAELFADALNVAQDTLMTPTEMANEIAVWRETGQPTAHPRRKKKDDQRTR